MNSRIIFIFCSSILNFWFAQGIINGKDASIKDFPYIVKITPRSGSWRCGGSIISNNWVLTTVQCVLTEPPSDYSVRSGTDLEDINGSVHRVDQIEKHENYRVIGGFSENNVALVAVEEPFLFYDYPFPIKLVEAGYELAPGVVANITGFGKTFKESRNLPLKLQSAEVLVMNMNTCKPHKGAIVPKGQFCAGQSKFGNACYRDEGGPMVVDGLLAGIISDVPDCFSEDNGVRPVMYIDVSYYRHWVDDKMRVNFKISRDGGTENNDRNFYKLK